MRKSFLPQVLSAAAIGFLGGITALSLEILPAQAQPRAGVIDLNYVKLCRSEADLRGLARYLRNQNDFGVTVEGLNNWRSNGLNVPKATESQRILVTGSVIIKTNGMKTTKIKNISVTLPLLSGANNGDYYNAATAVLRVRAVGEGNELCFNAQSNQVGKLFNINSRYDFSWEDVKIQDLMRQTPANSSEQDGIVITSY